MLRATGEVQDSDTLVLALTLTMTLGEWKQIASALPSAYPGCQVASVIDRAVRHFSERYAERYETGPYQ